MNPVVFVSLGPGEPELITVKGLKALQEADCIFCPETTIHGSAPTSRALNILLALGIPEQNISRFTLPMSKNRDKAIEAYNHIMESAMGLYRQNKKVCIVAEGDAGLYSSIHYIYENLQTQGVPVKQIAGIPAFIAAGALGGLHLAKQEEQLTIVPGTTTADEIEQIVNKGNVVVVMKLSQCQKEILRCIDMHPEYNYHYFENVGTPKELYIYKPEEIAGLRFPYFSLMIISPKQ